MFQDRNFTSHWLITSISFEQLGPDLYFTHFFSLTLTFMSVSDYYNKMVWKKFKELLPVLSSCHLSFKTHGRMYSSCVRSAMLHANETLPLTKPNPQCLQQNDRTMIRQICNVKPQQIQWATCVAWHWGSGPHSEGEKIAFDIQVDGKHGPGRPKMAWKQLTERDCREWKLSAIDLHDRHTWRSGVRSAMRAASQLPGRGP